MRFSKKKNLKETQKEFYFVLEKIVNIALAKTKRGDNQSVIDILSNLKIVFEKFWDLKKKNPQKFKSLLWSYDFFENYVQPIENNNLPFENSEEEPKLDKLKKDASYILAFNSERQLKGITLFIKSYEKVWQCAFHSGNDEVSRYAVYNLVWMLDSLVHESSNNLCVKQFLEIINSITFQATRSSKLLPNSSVYTAAVYWYFNIFDKFSPNKKQFDLSYLELFDKYLFNSMKIIVSNGCDAVFNVFVTHLHDGVHIPSYYKGDIWEYISLGFELGIEDFSEYSKSHGLHEKAKKLAELEDELDTKNNLAFYLKELNEIDAILGLIFNEEQKEKAKVIENNIKEFVNTQFKFNNLLDITFDICSYCIFKQKIDYVKYLWEYKQPSDADASYAGQGILPNEMYKSFNIYFRRINNDCHFEDHHGSVIYQTQYLLVILTYLHEHLNRDLEIKVSNSMNIDKLEREYIFVNKFLSHSELLIKTCEILLYNSEMWEPLLFLEKEIAYEYQPEYENKKVRVTANKQFENIKTWLEVKVTEFDKLVHKIESFLPIDPEKESLCKKEIIEEFHKQSEIAKCVTIKEFETVEDKDLNFSSIYFLSRIPKPCLLHVSYHYCSYLNIEHGIKVASEEIKYFIEKIMDCEDIGKVDINNPENILSIYDAIEFSINELKSDCFSPTTILIPQTIFSDFLKETSNNESKVYNKFTRDIFKFDESTQLDILSIPFSKFNSIIILDKNDCIFTFKSVGKSGERIHININECENDPRYADVKTNMMVNLEIVHKNAIKKMAISKNN